MLESLTATSLVGGGTATAIPTVKVSLGTIEKQAKKRGAASCIASTDKNAVIIASLTSSVSTGSTIIGDQIKYPETLSNAYACVESMSDEQLEQALIQIGELEGKLNATEEKAHQYVKQV